MMKEKVQQIQKLYRLHYLNKLLVNFGEKLQCHEKYYEDGKTVAEEIFKTLQHSHYNLASFHIGGSFGKKTDVIEPDLDLVVLINNCHPPLKAILDEFKYILMCVEDDLKIRPGVYKQTGLSLNFSFTNGISVDLLPAANIKKDEMKKVFKEMKDHKYAYFYNPSFVEHQIAFMKSQDKFTHTLARISKFWLKSFNLGESCNGGSAMMELIAVAAAESESNYEEQSTLRAFIRVLDTMMNLPTTKLAFIHYKCNKKLQKWKRMSPNDLNINNSSAIIPQIVGKNDILRRRCFMIDPANPFQDYLEDKTDSLIEKLSVCAQVTLSRLEFILNRPEMHGLEIQELFEPLPDMATYDDDDISLPKNILVTHAEVCDSVHNEIKIFDEDEKKFSKARRRAVNILKSNLLTVIHSTVKGKAGKVSKNDVKNAVIQLLGNNPKINLKHTENRCDHNWHYDARIRVPYVINGTGYAVRISMTWKSSFPISQSELSSNNVGCIKKCCISFRKLVIYMFVVWIFIVYITH